MEGKKTIYIGLVPEEETKESLCEAFETSDVTIIEADEVGGRQRHAFAVYSSPEKAREMCESREGYKGMRCGLVKKGPAAISPSPDTSSGPMSRVHVILVGPQQSSNVGAVARLCGSFGTGRLCIVRDTQTPSDIITNISAQRASTHGRPWLDDTLMCDSLEEARSSLNCVRLIAFSARTGHTGVRGDFYNVETVADEVSTFLEENEKIEQHVGLVFGRESTGLNNVEVSKCETLTTIPVGGVLNLSHSVSVSLYVFASAFNHTKTQKSISECCSNPNLSTEERSTLVRILTRTNLTKDEMDSITLILSRVSPVP